MTIFRPIFAGVMLAALIVACAAMLAIHHIGRRAQERRAP